MLELNVKDETARLRAVVLGTAQSNGPTPTFDEAYDPKSREHILASTYPKEADMVAEMKGAAGVLGKYDVQVFRPQVIQGYNQIFARDIAFVIDDKLVISNILPHRQREIEAIGHVIAMVDPPKVLHLPEKAHVEGGDVMPWHDYIFVGTYTGKDYADYITARTNLEAVKALQALFPEKKVKAFELRKSNTDPMTNALHLDCCFQPVGEGKAVIHKNGFLKQEDYLWLVDYFGKENIFEVSAQEMYHMNCNFFSISPQVVLSDVRFTRLNNWFRSLGIKVEEIPFGEVAKQEGLLRCSTMPLIRD